MQGVGGYLNTPLIWRPKAEYEIELDAPLSSHLHCYVSSMQRCSRQDRRRALRYKIASNIFHGKNGGLGCQVYSIEGEMENRDDVRKIVGQFLVARRVWKEHVGPPTNNRPEN